MQYILSEQEWAEIMAMRKEWGEVKPTKALVKDLRAIVLRNAGFKCHLDMSEAERREKGVDEGYCDGCPLTAFGDNERLKARWSLCGTGREMYSK